MKERKIKKIITEMIGLKANKMAYIKCSFKILKSLTLINRKIRKFNKTKKMMKK